MAKYLKFKYIFIGLFNLVVSIMFMISHRCCYNCFCCAFTHTHTHMQTNLKMLTILSMLCNSSFFFISFISLCFWLATQHKATQHNTAQHSTAHDEKNSNNINSKNKMHVLDIVWHLHCTLHTHKHTSSWTHLEKKKYFLQLCIMQISRHRGNAHHIAQNDTKATYLFVNSHTKPASQAIYA